MKRECETTLMEPPTKKLKEEDSKEEEENSKESELNSSIVLDITKINALKDIFKCSICLQLISDTNMVCYNGHHVCYSCYYEYKKTKGHAICPVCKKKFIDTYNPLIIKQLYEVINLKQECHWKDRGCDMIIPMSDFDRHKLFYCKYRDVVCSYCSKDIEPNRDAIIEHYKKHTHKDSIYYVSADKPLTSGTLDLEFYKKNSLTENEIKKDFIIQYIYKYKNHLFIIICQYLEGHVTIKAYFQKCNNMDEQLSNAKIKLTFKCQHKNDEYLKSTLLVISDSHKGVYNENITKDNQHFYIGYTQNHMYLTLSQLFLGIKSKKCVIKNEDGEPITKEINYIPLEVEDISDK